MMQIDPAVLVGLLVGALTGAGILIKKFIENKIDLFRKEREVEINSEIEKLRLEIEEKKAEIAQATASVGLAQSLSQMTTVLTTDRRESMEAQRVDRAAMMKDMMETFKGERDAFTDLLRKQLAQEREATIKTIQSHSDALSEYINPLVAAIQSMSQDSDRALMEFGTVIQKQLQANHDSFLRVLGNFEDRKK